MERFNDNNIVDLSQFKKKKEDEKVVRPLFTEPRVFVLGDPDDESKQSKHLLTANIVYEGRQYVALEKMDVPEREYYIAECALNENGEFAGLLVVETDEIYEKVSEILYQLLEGDKDDDTNN